MKKVVLFAMIVSFSLVSYATVFAQADPAESNRGFFKRRCITKWEMFRFMRNLDITAEQKIAFKDLAEAMDNAFLVELQREEMLRSASVLMALLPCGKNRSQSNQALWGNGNQKPEVRK